MSNSLQVIHRTEEHNRELFEKFKIANPSVWGPFQVGKSLLRHCCNSVVYLCRYLELKGDQKDIIWKGTSHVYAISVY